MGRTKSIVRVSAFGILFAMNLGCFENKKNDHNDQTTGLLALLSINPTLGNYVYYNGTPNYPGGTYTAAGNVAVGEYNITNSLITRYDYDTGYGASHLYGEVQEVDLNRQVVYVRFRSDSTYSAGDYAWYRWTYNGGYLYICPDLSGVSNQTTLAAAKASNVDYYSDPTNINTGCGLNSGFSPTVWSRLQSK
ncbi:hypothetical protein EHO60_05995 [Leptospira fletcheri]|uniref:Uncharacterized protein n=1 Tax=Leptospira fletcheri TaxID=2484981 RepID=A0A4R9GGM3_9LEPT|nr:hypothetical protein [Leptospira fletcheri]TGK11840.1 hypothetical protein EHO60_05995 [Leptospira fletcheri]